MKPFAINLLKLALVVVHNYRRTQHKALSFFLSYERDMRVSERERERGRGEREGEGGRERGREREGGRE
jgi:hypothetical protein